MSREQKAVARARKAFETGRSKPVEHRIHQLKNLQRLLTERKKEIGDAIKKDLGKVSSTSASTLSSESEAQTFHLLKAEAYSWHLFSDQMPQITNETFEEQIHWWTCLSLQYLSFAKCKMVNNFIDFFFKAALLAANALSLSSS